MKYHIKDSTLVIKGGFTALSSGPDGGRRYVEYLINHQVKSDFDHNIPGKYIEKLINSLNITGPYFGLLTAVSMDNLYIITDDYLTTFVTAGITHPSDFRVHKAGTINIILVIDATLSESAMVGAVITTTEAKALALMDMGYDFMGTTTDAVIVAYEKSRSHFIEYAGPYTELGRKITNTVFEGVSKGVKKTERSQL